jgi:hypothetical protein
LVDDLGGWDVSSNITLSALGGLLKILRKGHPELPKDPRTIMRPSTDFVIQTVADGSYYHFGLSSCLVNVIDNVSIDGSEILLQINVDGLPLFKSTSSQFWPILGLSTNAQKREPFVIGIYYGNSKSTSAKEYLQQLLVELNNLMTICLNHGQITYCIVLTAIVCDTPARAFIKNIKGHSGYHECDKRCQERVFYERRMTFPETKATLRTDAFFLAMEDEDHHAGPSPFCEFSSVDMISKFPLDYMHLICLGVMRKLLNLWVKGPLHIRIGTLAVRHLSDALIICRDQVPCEFTRKPRRVNELDRWKATEFCQFLLYTGPLVLHDVLSLEMYSNFVLLYVSMHILLSPLFCSQYCNFASDLLQPFVKNVGEIYGNEALTYNVHATVHLADEIKLHGCLDSVSGFVFENHSGKIKKDD